MKWAELVGMEVAALRAFDNSNKKLSYMLFSDGKTFIELDEQDPFRYHDCSSVARILTLRQDEVQWKKMFDMASPYVELSKKVFDPF